MDSIEIGIIGGSGLYEMDDLTEREARRIDTPFGAPSDAILIGTLRNRRVAFLPRHGRGHVHNPSEVPYRANIYALKTLGVKYLIAISACGSLRESMAPGHIVVPDQLFDFTKGKRAHTFFENGFVAHVGVADPFSIEMSKVVGNAVQQAGGTLHPSGTFITIEGPRFSTKAESNLFRQWGMSIIGMTTSPEAYLAREAEMAYACMAHVTDYDVWHETEEPVSVEQVIRIVHKNTAVAQSAIRHLVESYEFWAGEWPAHSALKNALITDRSKIPARLMTDLDPLIHKYFS